MADFFCGFFSANNRKIIMREGKGSVCVVKKKKNNLKIVEIYLLRIYTKESVCFDMCFEHSMHVR